MRILVIEDEKKVANFIKKGLEEEHYAVDHAYDGESGLYMTEVNEYDLIVLDLMIPEIDGLEVLKRIFLKKLAKGRQEPSLPNFLSKSDKKWVIDLR